MSNDFPFLPVKTIPFVTGEQMIEVDKLMIEDFNISLIQMMENASLNLARLCRALYPDAENFIVLAGKGNNGGGGLGAARRLHNWGFNVIVLLVSDIENYKNVPIKQLEIIEKTGIKIIKKMEKYEEIFKEYLDKTIIIDALLGYSLKGAPRGKYAKLINYANKSNLPIISLDIPSGIEGTSGLVHTPAIKADATLTLALPKTAFYNQNVKVHLGRLFVADISVPFELYQKMGLNVEKNLFSKETIVEIKFE